jgi:hypothetical protein
VKEIKIFNKDGRTHINDVQMGDDFAQIYMSRCDRHGSEQPHLAGNNQGGYDGMDICLRCCHEISSVIFGDRMDEIIDSLK